VVTQSVACGFELSKHHTLHLLQRQTSG